MFVQLTIKKQKKSWQKIIRTFSVLFLLGFFFTVYLLYDQTLLWLICTIHLTLPLSMHLMFTDNYWINVKKTGHIFRSEIGIVRLETGVKAIHNCHNLFDQHVSGFSSSLTDGGPWMRYEVQVQFPKLSQSFHKHLALLSVLSLRKSAAFVLTSNAADEDDS